MYNLLFSRSGLSLERLRTFVEVADAGSMAKAAGGDTVRQSLFSRQIKELEEHFGRKLTQRVGRNVELTAEGRELAALARESLGALEAFHVEATEAAGMRVVLGAGESFLRGVVLARLVEIRARLPGVVLELRNLRGLETAEALDDGKIDFGVIDDEAKRPGLGTTRLGKVGYRLVSAEATDWRAAMALPFVVLEGAEFLEKQAEELAAKSGRPLITAVRCASWHGVADSVAIICGGAFLPDTVATPKGCVEVATPRLNLPERTLWLAWSTRRGDLRKGSSDWRRVLGEVLKF